MITSEINLNLTPKSHLIFCGQHKYYPSPGRVYVLTLHEDREEDERAHIAVGGDEIVHDVTVVLHRLLKQTQANIRQDND